MIDSPALLHRAFQEAFNQRDLESIVALYEPGAVLVGASGPVRGTDAIRERYRAVLTSRPAIELRTLSVDVAGGLAMIHGTWVLHEVGPDGRQVNRAGRNAETARQQADGGWLFVVDNPSVPQE
jgi:uncharacterized protein (TIGR02246 family)